MFDEEISTEYGGYRLRGYRQTNNNQIHLALTLGQWNHDEPVLVRINSSVVENDILKILAGANDKNYSKRIGHIKTLFTKSFRGNNALPKTVSISRQKHRESNVWQRRFWEHTIQDESELETYLNYIHYNPVKHGLVSCPHLWSYSSFHSWVQKDGYSSSWGCVCQGKLDKIPNFDNIKNYVGE